MTDAVLSEKKGGILYITLNRVKKANTISASMYHRLAELFEGVNDDDDVFMVVLTGAGAYYSGGSDFSPEENSNSADEANPDTLHYKVWVDKIIRCKKIVIALINGPCIGIAVTTLALFDAVFASDKAYFKCPFTDIGVVPEACSSYTFIQNLGYQNAARLALFAEKITADEALRIGLIAKVIPHAQFATETAAIIDRYSKLAKQSLLVSKKLMRPPEVVDRLAAVNRRECEALIGQMSCEETLMRVMNMFKPKM